jgi:NAD(P)-dependent dehydrogenase (short-subunit alcohol dehydrogenase family)
MGEVMTPDATRLDGEVAVITGGAGGIGAGVARTFAAAGARVAVADRDAAAAAALAAELGDRHLALEIDVRSGSSVRAAVADVRDALGVATILFNGAGVQRVRPTVELT